jgi:hypothetical protein
MTKPYEIRQFKLASGEEIVCEIITWNNEEELELVVRKAMKLVLGEMETGMRYYSFRPWMVYQENPEDFVVLNGNHVVGIGYPPESLMEQYDEAVDEMAKMYEDRTKEFRAKKGNEYKSAEEINELTKSLLKTTEDLDDYVKSLDEKDSSSNVINMFDFNKDNMH